MDCVFCKIIVKQLPATQRYEDKQLIAFDDIQPCAPVHILIIPRLHIATLNDTSEQDNLLLGHMIQTACKLAQKLDIAEQGYRTVFNCNKGANQHVYHLHLHLLGGRLFHWPPG